MHDPINIRNIFGIYRLQITLLSTYIIDWKSKFQLQIRSNEVHFFPHPRSRIPWNLRGPQAKNGRSKNYLGQNPGSYELYWHLRGPSGKYPSILNISRTDRVAFM